MSLRKLTDGKNSVIFSAVLEEEDTRANEITDKSVEDGSTVSDHIHNKPLTLRIEGTVAGRPYSEKAYSQLNKFWKEKKLLKYYGRVEVSNVQIQLLTTSRDKNIADGFNFVMILQTIPIVKKTTVKINTKKLKIPDIETLKAKLEEERNAKKTKLKKKTKKGKKGKKTTKKSKERPLAKIKRQF